MTRANALLAAALTKPPKYRAKPVEVDGERFDSKLEGKRWCELLNAQKAGDISDLRRQVRYPLLAEGGVCIAHYVADFVYLSRGADVETIEDAKGKSTAMYKLKRRWMRAQYGVDIVEIRARGKGR